MQQPSASPDDEYDDEPTRTSPLHLSAEELAERAALEVFPGTPTFESLDWSQQTGRRGTEPIEFVQPDAVAAPRVTGTEALESEADPAIPGTLADSAIARPSQPGRRSQNDAGASQRAAILAAAGAASDVPATTTGPAGQTGGSRLTRKTWLSLLIIALAIATLSVGAIAPGPRAEVERVAGSLAPDVIERWIADRMNSFGGATAVPSVVVPEAPAPAVADTALLVGQIAHTGGSGVSVRPTCAVEARTADSIAEGARIVVIARGVGSCAGWHVVQAGATVSWVEGAYLGPITAP